MRLAEKLAPQEFGGSMPARKPRAMPKQLARVAKFLSDGQWRTLREIADATGCGETSASARFRELKNWGYITDSKPTQSGRWIYRVVVVPA